MVLRSCNCISRSTKQKCKRAQPKTSVSSFLFHQPTKIRLGRRTGRRQTPRRSLLGDDSWVHVSFHCWGVRPSILQAAYGLFLSNGLHCICGRVGHNGKVCKKEANSDKWHASVALSGRIRFQRIRITDLAVNFILISSITKKHHWARCGGQLGKSITGLAVVVN